jgi:hypothetical protein
LKTLSDALSGAVRSPELRTLAETSGLVATVYLTTRGDVENAADVSDQRWRVLRSQLLEQGADEATLDRVDPLIASAHEHGPCLAVIASAQGLLHVEHGSEAPPGDFGCWDALPVLGLLIQWRQSSPPYVVVVTDRRGADITVVGRRTTPVTHTVEGGDDLPIRKVAPGGWSQHRYQQRAENTWESHARQIADDVQRASGEVNADIIVVAGDVRAVELLEKHLPEHLVQQIEEIPGGRSSETSDERIHDATQRWVMTAVARETVALLEKFREQRGQHDRAADGADATLRALSQGQVEVLLVHDDWHDTRRAWFGSAQLPVAIDQATLKNLGVSDAVSGRLVDVAIQAALRTGASVWTVPHAGGPTDGIGAILRWG